MALMSGLSLLWPKMQRDGWVSVVPTTALIWAVPWHDRWPDDLQAEFDARLDFSLPDFSAYFDASFLVERKLAERDFAGTPSLWQWQLRYLIRRCAVTIEDSSSIQSRITALGFLRNIEQEAVFRDAVPPIGHGPPAMHIGDVAPRIIDVVVQAAMQGPASVRTEALKVLGLLHMDHPRAAAAILIVMSEMNDSYEAVGFNAGWQLYKFVGPHGPFTFTRGTIPEFGLVATEAGINLDTPADGLVAFARKTRDQVEPIVLLAYLGITSPEVERFLIERLTEGGQREKRAVVTALEVIAPPSADAANALCAAAVWTDRYTRMTAIRALAAIGPAAHDTASALIDRLDKVTETRDPDILQVHRIADETALIVRALVSIDADTDSCLQAIRQSVHRLDAMHRAHDDLRSGWLNDIIEAVAEYGPAAKPLVDEFILVGGSELQFCLRELRAIAPRDDRFIPHIIERLDGISPFRMNDMYVGAMWLEDFGPAAADAEPALRRLRDRPEWSMYPVLLEKIDDAIEAVSAGE